MKLHHVSLKRERKSCKIPRVIMSELYFSLIWLGVNGVFPHHLHISCHQTALFKTKLSIYAEVSLLDAKHVFPCFHGMLHVFLFLNSSTCYLSVRIKCVDLIRRSISKSFSVSRFCLRCHVWSSNAKCIIVFLCLN